MYKALITDIDNTLVEIGEPSGISELTVTTVSEALQKGIHISVATGRGWQTAKPVVERLGLVDICIIEGGGCIIDPKTEKIVWQQVIDAETSNQVLTIFKEYATSTELIKSSGKPEKIALQTVNDYLFENRVIYLLGATKEIAELVKQALSGVEMIAVNLTNPSWAGPDLFDVHVTHRYGNKEHALNEWYRLMGITQDECVGMGDATNDLPLFNAVGLKVAVANATEELKEKADYIAPDLHNDPLMHVLKKFFKA